jgi:hypothetical protein
MNNLAGMITGLGQVEGLSTLNGSDRAAQDGCTPTRLTGPPALAFWANRAVRGRRPVGPPMGFGP